MGRFILCLLLQLCVALLVIVLPASAQSQEAAGWTRENAVALLSYIDQVGGEGLDPADYEPAALRTALERSDLAVLAVAATSSFTTLARDLSYGHVPDENRIAWHIRSEPPTPQAIAEIMLHALLTRDVPGVLALLAPDHPEYRALKAALARTEDGAARTMLRVNMERWRWMPRALGYRHLLVNVPAFRVDLIQNGRLVSRHRVITGALKTPTPQFDALVTGVILNPSWYVPQSIIAESVGRLVRTRPAEAARRGYVATYDQAGRLQVRQMPGPGNALGVLKLDMPNRFSIYLHDTPAKALFEKPVRAFSHGCIRTDQATDLAAALLDGHDGWDAARIGEVVATRETSRVALPAPVPVYVAYFTAASDGKGGVTFYDDIYGRDDAVATELDDRRGDEIVALFRQGLSECSRSGEVARG
jgi:murein L,D-transpeptidase YcbB/YkuD